MKWPALIPTLITAGLASAQTIVCPPGAPANLKLAAKEIRRHVYLRTGELLPLAETGEGISLQVDPALAPQQYRLKTAAGALAISGGSGVAVLYGAYAFAEKLGVRFYLHGDVIPDEKIPFAIPPLDETRKPLFETRGIQPFHDFPEGPDWWSTDDYRACMAQLPKLKMNFIGFHNYPGELLLWHGVAEDVSPDGTVKTSYPSKWFRNSRSGWGYAALKTSDFTAGAAELFPVDHVFVEVVGSDNRHFDRVGRMLGTIVKDAHARGIKVAVGTETPLHIPAAAQARLKELHKADAAREIYQGTFTWLMRNAPVDYYWAWTPEGWIWSGNSIAQYQAVETDLKAAQAALAGLGDPFPLGTCGWVLGPQQNRAAWDELLPKIAPIANINPLAGHAPIDPGFSSIKDRPKWAIPWFENGPGALRAIRDPWEKLRAAHYTFVEKFATLRPQVNVDGNLERFDYWLTTFRATELMAKLACQRGALDVAVEKLKSEQEDPAARRQLAQAALGLRQQLARGWEELIRIQIALVSTPGELGTIANLEQHSRVNNRWLTVHDPALAGALGVPLPADCTPAKTYDGPARLIVPTVRSIVNIGETLRLKIIALDRQPVKSVSVKVRQLGKGDWRIIPAVHLSRAVFEAKLPAAGDDFEYQVMAITAAGSRITWPATAPQMNQTVVTTKQYIP